MGIYFWDNPNKPIGLNADIERHRKHQKELEEKISELESIENPSEMDKFSIRAYRNFLCKLLQSKAELLEKFGRK